MSNLLKPIYFEIKVDNEVYKIFYKETDLHIFTCYNPSIGRSYNKKMHTKASALEKVKENFKLNIQYLLLKK